MALLIVLALSPARADQTLASLLDQGWHWYNDPQEEPAEETVPSPVLTAPQQMLELQKQTKAALHTAILYPTVANVARYLKFQHFWTGQAGKFSQATQQTLLAQPDLDYNLQHSHYNSTVKTQLAADKQQQAGAIQALAARYGVLFFYRGGQALDNQMVPVIKAFSQQHRIALLPVAVDGARSRLLPGSRPDNGQAARLGIRHFPALILVAPQEDQVQALAYGFITQDDLARRFLNVATGFAPRF
jgi:conjugal transfer pilus assembly protein TraF